MNPYKDVFDLDSVEIKVVRIFLIAFVLLLGYQSIQFINTRRIDKKHHELLLVKNQSIEALQEMLVQSSTIQRKLLNLALTSDPIERNDLEKIILTAAANNDKSLADLEKSTLVLTHSAGTDLAALKKASEDYRSTYRTFTELILAGENMPAMEFKDNQLRPVYETFQRSLQQMLVNITDDLIMQSDKLSSYATRSGWILFFIGLIPFIFAILKLAYLLIYLRIKYARVSIHDGDSGDKL